MSTRSRPRSGFPALLGAALVVAAAVVFAAGREGPQVVAPSPARSLGPSLDVEVASPWAASPAAPVGVLGPWPSVSLLPSPYDFPTPAPTPAPTPKPTKAPDIAAGPTTRVATRIVVPGLGIDLPVMRQKANYPECDVAMYLPQFKQPGQGGATYLYAHAQRGMFLPLLTQSKRNNGSAMLGMSVYVYTGDNLRFRYEITRVRRHARDFNPVVAARGETIWLQTSEGPNASYPKLQVAGTLVGRGKVSHDEAHPKPRPRRC